MAKKQWVGETGCANYSGVKRITERRCCGGKVTKFIKVGCLVHPQIYAHSCHKETCGYYKQRADSK